LRLQQNFLGGETDTALTDVATTLSSPALAAMVAVTAPDTMDVVLDPDGIGGAPEIVTVTAHTAASTTATITRGSESTTARAHATGVEWVQAFTTGAWDAGLDSVIPLLLHVRDEKAAATDGGASVAATWQTRTLNTVKTNEISGASLASDRITLPAGTYECDISAPAIIANSHRARLYNVTAAATVLVGTSEYSWTGDTVLTRSFIRGRFTLSATTDLRVEHRTGSARSPDGFGVATSFGEVEVYTDVMIRKVG